MELNEYGADYAVQCFSVSIMDGITSYAKGSSRNDLQMDCYQV